MTNEEENRIIALENRLTECERRLRRHKHDNIETDNLPQSSIKDFQPDATILYATNFESTDRFQGAVGGSGSQGVGISGIDLNTESTGASYSRLYWRMGNNNSIKLFSNTPRFTVSFIPDDIELGTGTGHFFAGIGEITVAGTGITFTGSHIGFKVVKSAGVMTLYATQSDGTEETVSLGAIDQDDVIEAYLEVGISSVTYVWRRNGGDWTTTTLSAHMPTADVKSMTFATSNVSTAAKFNFILIGSTFQSS